MLNDSNKCLKRSTFEWSETQNFIESNSLNFRQLLYQINWFYIEVNHSMCDINTICVWMPIRNDTLKFYYKIPFSNTVKGAPWGNENGNSIVREICTYRRHIHNMYYICVCITFSIICFIFVVCQNMNES